MPHFDPVLYHGVLTCSASIPSHLNLPESWTAHLIAVLLPLHPNGRARHSSVPVPRVQLHLNHIYGRAAKSLVPYVMSIHIGKRCVVPPAVSLHQGAREMRRRGKMSRRDAHLAASHTPGASQPHP